MYIYCQVNIVVQGLNLKEKAIPTKRLKLLFGHRKSGEVAASCRLLRLRLAYLRMGDHCYTTVPTHPLFAKNSSPNCFINAKTLTGQETASLNTIIQKKKPNETNVSLGFLVRVKGLDRLLRILSACRPNI